MPKHAVGAGEQLGITYESCIVDAITYARPPSTGDAAAGSRMLTLLLPSPFSSGDATHAA
jgi:hypothetical protein